MTCSRDSYWSACYCAKEVYAYLVDWHLNCNGHQIGHVVSSGWDGTVESRVLVVLRNRAKHRELSLVS
jgi:hypothetical protein